MPMPPPIISSFGFAPAGGTGGTAGVAPPGVDTDGSRWVGCFGIRWVPTLGCLGIDVDEGTGRQPAQKLRLSAVEAFPTRKSSSLRSWPHLSQ